MAIGQPISVAHAGADVLLALRVPAVSHRPTVCALMNFDERAR
jgi:hypothetical protein